MSFRSKIPNMLKNFCPMIFCWDYYSRYNLETIHFTEEGEQLQHNKTLCLASKEQLVIRYNIHNSSKYNHIYDNYYNEMRLIRYSQDYGYHGNGVTCMIELKSNGHVLTGSEDNTVKEWSFNRETFSCLRTFSSPSPDTSLYSLVEIDDDSFASGGFKVVKIWQLSTGVCLREFLVHSMEVTKMIVLKDPPTLDSKGRKREYLNFVNKPEASDTSSSSSSSPSSSSSSSSNNNNNNNRKEVPSVVIASCSSQRTKVWRTSDGLVLRSLEFKPSDNFYSLREMVQLRDGRLVTADDPHLSVWNIASGKCEAWFKAASTIIAGVLETDSPDILTIASYDRIATWNIATKQCLGSIQTKVTLCIAPLLHNGGGFIAGVETKLMMAWDKQHRELFSLQSEVRVDVMLELSDGRVMTGGKEGRIDVWTTFYR